MTELIDAIKSGDRELASLVVALSDPADVIETDDDGNTALHFAVRLGDEKLCKELIKRGADILTPNNNGEVALSPPFLKNNDDLLFQLVTYHWKLSAIRVVGLHHFAREGKIQECLYLIEDCGVDPNLIKYGSSPLHVASEAGHLELCIALIKRLADPNLGDEIYGKTALHIAAEAGNVELCVALIKHGADTNIRSKRGMSALDIAAEAGNVELCIALIKHEVIPESRSKNKNMTALHIAAEKGHGKVCIALIDRGVDPNQKNIMNETALHIAAEMGHEDYALNSLSTGQIQI